MHGPRRMFWSFKLAFHEGFVDDHLRSDIREFTPLLGFHMLSHGLEVALHSIHADRDAIDEQERFRMFGEHRREGS